MVVQQPSKHDRLADFRAFPCKTAKNNLVLDQSDNFRVQNKDPLDPATVRTNLAQLIERSGDSMAALSRMLGRNPAYIQQFIRKGSPQRLDEDDRLRLAVYFGVDERLLGARDPWTPGRS